jgi:hypothetical protein
MVLLLFSTPLITNTIIKNNLQSNLAYGTSAFVNSHDVQLQAEVRIKDLSNITSSNTRSQIQIHVPLVFKPSE